MSDGYEVNSWESWMMRYQGELRTVWAQFETKRPDYFRSANNQFRLSVIIQEAVEYLLTRHHKEWKPNLPDLIELYTSHVDAFDKRTAGGRPQERFPSGHRVISRGEPKDPVSDAWLEFFQGQQHLGPHPLSNEEFLTTMKTAMGGDGPDGDEYWNYYGGEKD